MTDIERIKLQIKNWPSRVDGEDIEITNMIADIVNREMWKVKRNIAEQLLEGDPAQLAGGSERRYR